MESLYVFFMRFGLSVIPQWHFGGPKTQTFEIDTIIVYNYRVNYKTHFSENDYVVCITSSVFRHV